MWHNWPNFINIITHLAQHVLKHIRNKLHWRNREREREKKQRFVFYLLGTGTNKWLWRANWSLCFCQWLSVHNQLEEQLITSDCFSVARHYFSGSVQWPRPTNLDNNASSMLHTKQEDYNKAAIRNALLISKPASLWNHLDVRLNEFRPCIFHSIF